MHLNMTEEYNEANPTPKQQQSGRIGAIEPSHTRIWLGQQVENVAIAGASATVSY